MSIAISEEHVALADAVRRWAEDRGAGAARAQLDSPDERLPSCWHELASQDWLGLHLSEARGGGGYGVAELAVVIEQLGRAMIPGPAVPSALAAMLIDRHGADALADALVPELAAGTKVAAVGLAGAGDSDLTAAADDAGGLVLHGSAGPVLGAGVADVLVAEATLPDGSHRWLVVPTSDATVTPVANLDETRRVAHVSFEGAPVAADAVLGGLDRARVRDLAATLLACEAAGMAGWCLDAAVEYAKVREQFGKPIGAFQAVKHRLANMLVAVEQARAVAWDASRAADAPAGDPASELAQAAFPAGTLGPEVAVAVAKDAIQVFGGIGFTWEHDVHLYLKRALAVRALLGTASSWHARAIELARTGLRRHLAVELPPEAQEHRPVVHEFLDTLEGLDEMTQRARMAEGGWVVPHLPAPWGRDADALEQMVIDEELGARGYSRPHLMVGGWVVPTLIGHGTEEQKQRWIPPTLRGEIVWCQLFSEPGAGSDLAALSTKAVKVPGGWELTGQKVWTSLAHEAQWGICLARTDPDVPKREGITYFVLDMAADGIEIRPLRELTGIALFNEVFLTDVFVPDDCVIGAVDDGWRVARSTLGHERVAMSSGSSFGAPLEIVAAVEFGREDDPVRLDQLGALLVEAQSLAVLAARATLRQLGGDEDAMASVRKLLGVEHNQRVAEFGLWQSGVLAATNEGQPGERAIVFLANRCLTIAGGTSEIQRNIIGERILGLPRDDSDQPEGAHR